MPLARRFGAAVVVGLIDEKGMAVSVERKLEVASAASRSSPRTWGSRAEDIWWDALVFPCGTGDENYIGLGAATIEAVRRLKQEMPETRTILGVSNVSFGLPTAGREVLNSVFLYHATQAGLDAAIVNTERLARYAEIPEEERAARRGAALPGARRRRRPNAAVDGLHRSLPRPQGVRRGAPARSTSRSTSGWRARWSKARKEGLIEDLELALADPRWPEPLDIINGPLMNGMAEVGRLFNANQLIVAEVLQSAEVMKAAVSISSRTWRRTKASLRGKVMLATVKGDVHDIGKNLVDIILTNNGFTVVNLGIKVPSEQLIQAVREHKPDVIGLSGLLVKSAQQMVATAGDLAAVGIDVVCWSAARRSRGASPTARSPPPTAASAPTPRTR